MLGKDDIKAAPSRRTKQPDTEGLFNVDRTGIPRPRLVRRPSLRRLAKTTTPTPTAARTTARRATGARGSRRPETTAPRARATVATAARSSRGAAVVVRRTTSPRRRRPGRPSSPRPRRLRRPGRRPDPKPTTAPARATAASGPKARSGADNARRRRVQTIGARRARRSVSRTVVISGATATRP